MLESLTLLSFLSAALVLFAFGFATDIVKSVRAGSIFLLAGFAIGIIWSSQCPLSDFFVLKCNPKGAIFLGMGVGLLLRAAIPLSNE